MMIYCALFKGINVGGKNIVKMADLKRVLLDAGLVNVKTYIQSGNVVFESLVSVAALHTLITERFQAVFGFSPRFTIRTLDQMASVIAALPFSDKEIADAESMDPDAAHLYVYFLDESFDRPLIEQIASRYADGDRVYAGTGVLYLLCTHSIRLSKLAAELSKTFKSATARNWRTVNKLFALMQTVR